MKTSLNIKSIILIGAICLFSNCKSQQQLPTTVDGLENRFQEILDEMIQKTD